MCLCCLLFSLVVLLAVSAVVIAVVAEDTAAVAVVVVALLMPLLVGVESLKLVGRTQDSVRVRESEPERQPGQSCMTKCRQSKEETRDRGSSGANRKNST